MQSVFYPKKVVMLLANSSPN